MKPSWLALFGAASVFFAACGDDVPDDPATDGGREEARLEGTGGTSDSFSQALTQQSEGLTEQTGGFAAQARASLEESWREVANYSADRKDEFVASLQEGAGEVDQLIESARRQMANLPEETREARADALEELEEARAELDAALADARRASGEAWQTARTEVAYAWDRLQQALAQYRQGASDS